MERSILDSALESPQACSSLIEQKPSELVARPSAVAVYFYVHRGIQRNRRRPSASHDWFGWVLDARYRRLLRSWTLGRSDSGLPDISREHHRGVMVDTSIPTSTPDSNALTGQLPNRGPATVKLIVDLRDKKK